MLCKILVTAKETTCLCFHRREKYKTYIGRNYEEEEEEEAWCVSLVFSFASFFGFAVKDNSTDGKGVTHHSGY